MATIQCMVHEAGVISRDRPALVGEDVRILYGELDLMVSSTAMKLREAGVKQGDVVGLFLENSWPQIVLIFALIRVGAVACPLHTRLPLAALQQHMDLAGARTLIARVRDASAAHVQHLRVLHPDTLVSRTLEDTGDAKDYTVPLNQPATIVFTSGSSGTPKAAVLTYGNHYYNALGANTNIRLHSEDTWLLSLPLYHVGGLGIVFRCLQSGAAMVLMKEKERVEEAIARHRVTMMSLVTAQLHRLLDHGISKEVAGKLRGIMLGGGPCSAELLQRARAQGLPVFMTYGMTEMGSQVTAMRPDSPPDKQMTAGVALRYREVRIMEDGEIHVRGPTRFAGYRDGDELRTPFDADGWFATGDLGALDEEGYLHVMGRKDDMFISGGENIHPQEIEQALCAVTGIHGAWVVPMDDEVFGLRPVAYVDADRPMDADEIKVLLSDVLPRFKIPVAIYPWPDELKQEGLKKSRATLRAFLGVRGTGDLR